MITKLTKAQEQQMAVYRDQWIKHGRSTEPLNEEAARGACIEFYKQGGLNPPKEIVFQPSPMAAVNYLKQRFPKLSNSDIYAAASWGNLEAGWISFYTYMHEVLGIEGAGKISGFAALAKQVGYSFVFDTIAVLTQRPTVLHINEANRLHCTNGPAIKYADGNAIYTLNGVTMPAWLFETPKEQLTGKQIMGITNVEQRGEAIKWYGLQNMLGLLDAKIVDESGCQYGYQVLDLDVGTTERQRYLRMLNPSTGEVHIEGVPPGTKTVRQALEARWPDTLRSKYGYKDAAARA